ncbi:RagB/SusD family nutrient uptake outer membrane protein [Tenacibaculum sp. 190524A05c]|uniref:RagB/SusD family nutrient uptake outer membrane protein n=1 Tax=Tenacibaculum platacis TaxID=3137852 RepID=UPI0032B1E499
MKKFKLLSIFVLGLLVSCQDNLIDTDIEPVNQNEPTLAALLTPTGMQGYAKGMYIHTTDPARSVNFWFVSGYHETMGDNLTMPWGNFGGRWVNQTASLQFDSNVLVPPPTGITIPASQTITPPAGGPQPGEIAVRNTRAAGSDNPTQYEWAEYYAVNNHANVILDNIDNTEDLSASQKDAYKAWALWWKAYAYSRLGLMYEQGVINDVPGATNNSFVNSAGLIAESERILDVLTTTINGVADATAFNAILSDVQIDIAGNSVDMAGLVKNINSLRARNLVYSTKVADMTAADWNNVITWCNNGVSANTEAFSMTSEATVLDNGWLPGVVSGFWYFPSPRLIQDINAGDNRLDAYFDPFVFPNPRGRGIQYGCNYFWKDPSPIVSGTAGAIKLYYGATHEENELLLAEAKIRTSDIEGGLAHLDAVRNLQNSGLPATVGTGLSQADAWEEVRKERRLALIFRGLAFYDARRYGIASGSRTGAWVVGLTEQVPNTDPVQTYTPVYTNATINYGYLEYWPVPAFESDFNSPGAQN